MSKLLVVDDEPSICWGLSRLGERLGHEVIVASSAEQALRTVEQTTPDVVVLDVRLPGMDGLTAISKLREHIGQVPIIVITAYGDLQTAVTAVRQGAFEYIVKPFDIERVRETLERALRQLGRPEDASTPAPTAPVAGLVGSTPAMQEVFNRIALAAAADACVLLQGESGTGKELVARAIHQYSRRATGPFVVVNIASLSQGLAESELFGHVRGAFTGADRARTGLLAQAHGGTLFLDEVAEIPLPVQVKLLRALEQKEVLPVGSDTTVRSDFRIISATHRQLLGLVGTGAFRHDLYFRLAAFQISLPSLRERTADIGPLAEHFIAQLAPGHERPGLAEETRAALARRPWYGNVRELRNAVEHALIMSRGGAILPQHLPPPAPASAFAEQGAEVDLETRIRELLGDWTDERLAKDDAETTLYERLLTLVEPPVLARVLAANGGQFVASSRTLGLHRTTLRKKAEQYRLGSDAE